MNSTQWIDTYAHVKPIQAAQANLTENPVIDRAFDEVSNWLNQPKINTWYERYMDLLNLRNNLGMRSELTPVNKIVQGVTMLSNLPFYATKGTAQLKESMQENEVIHAMLANHEPFSMAKDVLHTCNDHPLVFSAIVNLSAESESSFEERFATAVEKGAKALLIHPILERMDAQSDHYHLCAKLCGEAKIPLVCRTGVTAYPGEYQAEFGEIKNFDSLVRKNPETRFIMTHSNLADYTKAIDFALTHSNTWLDSAWQTEQAIRTIISNVGAERFLLASDWPVFGNQQKVQLRIFKKLDLSDAESKRIRFENAIELFNLKSIQTERPHF